MKPLPEADIDTSLMIRTEFSDDTPWEKLQQQAQIPSEEGFLANLNCLCDKEYDGLTVEQMLALEPKESGHYFVFLADATCLQSNELPIQVVDLNNEPGRTFRVIPSKLWSVENNLSIGNMDFHEFADSIDADGVFRGFP